ncbi:MAG: hypothetical protein U5K81_06655 [Trueperaceae bacterium]|nr:hypothetical protein [Trueperaceae bacterium]
MTRTLPLLLLASALLAGAALAQPAPLPDDERFDQTVSFSTGRQGEDLDTMLSALARSVGLTPVVDDVPEETIRYDIDEPTPFRQVWNLILSLNDLDYVLQENDVIVIGPTDALASLRRAEPRTDDAGAPAAADTVQRVYRVNGSPNDLAGVVGRLVPGARTVEELEDSSRLLVGATETQHDKVQAALDEFDEEPRELRRYEVRGSVEKAAEYLASFVSEGDSIAARSNSNIVIVTTTPSGHARVEEALEAYDSLPSGDAAAAAERDVAIERRVYRVNGEAENVKSLIKTLVPELQGSGDQETQRWSVDDPRGCRGWHGGSARARSAGAPRIRPACSSVGLEQRIYSLEQRRCHRARTRSLQIRNFGLERSGLLTEATDGVRSERRR